ncbi:MAG: DNA polymerase I [Planctomycetes bacterium]|nr:DNA polymerase I [Planctomycetota bacterium]
MPETIPAEELQQSLFLLDGSALAYRSHFAMARSNLSSADGVPTGATYGFASEVKRIIDNVSPKWFAVVMDTKAKTFRHELFEDYKGTRQKTPDELVEQLPYIKDAARVLGVPVLELDGFEADDIIGTLARRAEADDLNVFIVSGDKDFMQIVSPRVRLYNIMKPNVELVIQGLEDVREKFGVDPDRVVDVLGLMGDSSDNVPGVKGIGEKGAKKLIVEHGSMEELFANPSENLSPSVRKKLEEGEEQGLLSKRLVTIDTNVPIDVTVQELLYGGPDVAAAIPFFRKLGFRNFVEAMSEVADGPVDDDVETTYTVVKTGDELEVLLSRLNDAPLYSVDTETTSLNPREARLVGFSFSMQTGEAFYVPTLADPPVVEDPPMTARGTGVIDALRPLLEDARPAKCGQNAKYDMAVMRTHGIRMRGLLTDTMIAAYLLEPHQRERGLDALSLRHFNYVKIKTVDLIGKGKDQLTMDLLPVEDVGHYACEDADFTFRLAERFLPRLEAAGLRKLHDEVEIPLVDVLADMEATGVRVDRRQLKDMAKVLQKQADALEQKIRDLAGDQSLNVMSPRQLGILLFETLEIHKESGYKPKKTKTGWGTSQAVLEALAEDHDLPRLVLEYRSLVKLLGTYIVPLPGLVDPEDGRIHASFNQTVAATGRLSSSDPNLQNVPIRTELGKKIREAFKPSGDDSVLLAADYSQVELRIMAHLSQDETMIQAFQNDVDIHADTAARVFGLESKDVDATIRGRAKAINFGILYGMGPLRLSRETGLTMDEARTFIKRYFDTFPAIQDFLSGLKDFTRQEGYAQTILGRRRPIPDINSSNGMLRSQAENMAVNTPIQGSAADLLKVAMCRIWRELGVRGLRSKMILTVHDELVFDVPNEELDRVQSLVRDLMEHAFPLDVPLKVDIGVGSNWLEAH